MLALPALLAFIVGLLIGLVAALFVARNRTERARTQAATEAATARAVLEERLRSTDELATGLRNQLAALQDDLRHRTEQLQQEAERRSAAEAQAARIPELESSLEALRASNADLGRIRSELEPGSPRNAKLLRRSWQSFRKPGKSCPTHSKPSRQMRSTPTTKPFSNSQKPIWRSSRRAQKRILKRARKQLRSLSNR